MKEKIYLGIDIGTTHLKVCAIKGNRVIASAFREEQKVSIGKWDSCMDADQIWKNVQECLTQVCIEIQGMDISGIGITSMAESCVLLDAAGKVLMPIIPWNMWNEEKIGKEDFPEDLQNFSLYQRTGLIWYPKYTINQLIYLKKFCKSVYEKIHCVLSVSDYILFCLTGKKATDESLACRTMLYHIFRREWDKELVKLAGVEGRLPEVIKDFNKWPYIKQNLAEQWNINHGVKVYIGGHDHLCAAKAEQIGESDVLNSMGTSEVYLGFLKEMPDLSRFYKKGIQIGIFRNRYYWICNLPSSGASIEWLRGLYSWNGQKITYEELMSENRKVPSPIMYLPFVNGCGTHRPQKLESAIKGIRIDTNLMEIAQGMYEGIACEVRRILELLNETEININRIVSVGGGTQNSILMQAKADVTNQMFEITQESQATVIGAALTGDTELEEVANIRKKVFPNRENRKAYDRKYQQYQDEIYKQLMDNRKDR